MMRLIIKGWLISIWRSVWRGGKGCLRMSRLWGCWIGRCRRSIRRSRIIKRTKTLRNKGNKDIKNHLQTPHKTNIIKRPIITIKHHNNNKNNKPALNNSSVIINNNNPNNNLNINNPKPIIIYINKNIFILHKKSKTHNIIKIISIGDRSTIRINKRSNYINLSILFIQQPKRFRFTKIIMSNNNKLLPTRSWKNLSLSKSH